ncbi:TonB-dependent receptor domain-containing protein [Rheinheimera tangshanensis]|uniref:TonB-dependent receptor plug domain-containing protein n=1 Tax=Rheinheimera tangshanensis TaxID=400153 RepID=A0A5C8LZN1_9GAMM|nr:TonB-dependent receptor [Rheinheimera tangshanensis]TXK82741.1 TonB-dependent receptor plug domain-containing protein [Rheinheimera tangshanensis]GGM49475.1 TonB-dependent receptor [Rheinheimera tangshanensis]
MFKQQKVSIAVRQVLFASTLIATGPVWAQSTAATEAASTEKAETEAFETIVVTGSVPGRTQIESAIAVTSVDAEMIKDFQPSSEAEVFRMIPGIQVAGTAGPGGNSNIAVRGLPVATGGSPFVQIQEDGLPTVLFGDLQFGNNDYWTRFDSSVDRVEGVRGGTAGTFSSQSPGAIINYISNYGEVEGGLLRLNTGVGHDEKKVDFRYGGSASDSVNFHVGGYVKQGKGPLDAAFNVSESAQVKANVTKFLADDVSYFRVLVKVADTQEPNYTGAPALANYDGNSFSDLRPYPGFDGRNQSNYSIHNQEFLIVNREGVTERVEMSGITTEAFSLGNELHYEFKNDIVLDNKMRWTDMSGGFTSPFFNAATTASVLGSTVNGAVVNSIRYANGPQAGELYDSAYLNNNTNVNTNIRDVGSFVNDLAVSKEFAIDDNTFTARAGYFYMNQNVAADWHTNRTYSELSGDNPAMLDLFDDAGNQLTANGIAGFNDNWGAGNARDYDLAYTDTAPYLALDFDTDLFTLDASVRRDTVDASGWTAAGGEVFNTVVDGVAIPTLIPNGARENLNYSVSYTSWTVGGLYKLNEDTSLFTRASKGGRFNGDRQTVSGKINADGSLNQQGLTSAVDFVNQYELGVKRRGEVLDGFYTFELTLLKGDFKQSTYELSATRCGGVAGGCVIDAEYKSQGAEILGTVRIGDFSLVGNATYSDAEKLSAGATNWTRADGIPDLIYTLSSNYHINDQWVTGLNITGQTAAIDGAGNEYPDNYTLGGSLRYSPTDNLEFGFQVYNLTDEFDIRGSGGLADATVTPTVISGNPVIGRTATASVTVTF